MQHAKLSIHYLVGVGEAGYIEEKALAMLNRRFDSSTGKNRNRKSGAEYSRVSAAIGSAWFDFSALDT